MRKTKRICFAPAVWVDPPVEPFGEERLMAQKARDGAEVIAQKPRDGGDIIVHNAREAAENSSGLKA